MDTTTFGALWDRWVLRGSHRSVGPVTAYPFGSAMYGAINISTRWGALCLSWPWLGRTWAATGLAPSLYLSPNSTPWAATLLLGGRWTREERRMAASRRVEWGHGYDVETHNPLAP